MSLSKYNSAEQTQLRGGLSDLLKFFNVTSPGYMSRVRAYAAIMFRENSKGQYNTAALSELYLKGISEDRAYIDGTECDAVGSDVAETTPGRYIYISPETGRRTAKSYSQIRSKFTTIHAEARAKLGWDEAKFCTELKAFHKQLDVSYKVSRRIEELLSGNNVIPDPRSAGKKKKERRQIALSKANPALTDVKYVPKPLRRTHKPGAASIIHNLMAIYRLKLQKATDATLATIEKHRRALQSKFRAVEKVDLILAEPTIQQAYKVASAFWQTTVTSWTPQTFWSLPCFLDPKPQGMNMCSTDSHMAVDTWVVSKGMADLFFLGHTANNLVPLAVHGCNDKESMEFRRRKPEEMVDALETIEGYEKSRYIVFSTNNSFGEGGQQVGLNPTGGQCTSEARRARQIEFLRGKIAGATGDKAVGFESFFEVHAKIIAEKKKVTVMKMNGETDEIEVDWDGKYFGSTTRQGREASRARYKQRQQEKSDDEDDDMDLGEPDDGISGEESEVEETSPGPADVSVGKYSASLYSILESTGHPKDRWIHRIEGVEGDESHKPNDEEKAAVYQEYGNTYTIEMEKHFNESGFKSIGFSDFDTKAKKLNGEFLSDAEIIGLSQSGGGPTTIEEIKQKLAVAKEDAKTKSGLSAAEAAVKAALKIIIVFDEEEEAKRQARKKREKKERRQKRKEQREETEQRRADAKMRRRQLHD